jgi:hypothetical protein
LDRLGVKLSLRLVVDAPVGVMTEELKAALLAHKPRLLALLAGVDDGTGPTGSPVSEPIRPAGPAELGPPPADRGWRRAVELWPVEWRERWGRCANALQDAGAPWDVAEWITFQELADAECRGEVTYTDPAPGLSDSEAVAGITLAFGDGGPARREFAVNDQRSPRRAGSAAARG